jgi:hypothetical protein
MRIWLALLASPTLALLAQSGMYALVTPSCSIQTRVAIHVLGFLCVAVSLVFTLMARGAWRRRAAAGGPSLDSDDAAIPASRRFLAVTATAVGTISTLVIVMMWFAAWVLSPCY